MELNIFIRYVLFIIFTAQSTLSFSHRGIWTWMHIGHKCNLNVVPIVEIGKYSSFLDDRFNLILVRSSNLWYDTIVKNCPRFAPTTYLDVFPREIETTADYLFIFGWDLLKFAQSLGNYLMNPETFARTLFYLISSSGGEFDLGTSLSLHTYIYIYPLFR